MDSVQPLRRHNPGIGQRQNASSQRQQMGSEIAAVDRRNVGGQRLEGLSVVPVIKVTIVALHSIHRAQRVRDALENLADGKIAKVVGG